MSVRARAARDKQRQSTGEGRPDTSIDLTGPAIDLNALHSVSELLRTWGRHWSAVGTLQRRLPLSVQRRLQSLDADPETALDQTLHLFAYEFPPEVVAAFRARIDAALETMKLLRPGADSDEALR